MIRLGTALNGKERSPMRVAEAKVTLGVVAARAGDLDSAVECGCSALQSARQSIPSIVMVGNELAAEIQRVGGPRDQHASEYLGELRAAGIPSGTPTGPER